MKAKLARNTIFGGNLEEIFANFGPKIAESDYFRGFYFSLSVFKSHILANNIASVFIRD